MTTSEPNPETPPTPRASRPAALVRATRWLQVHDRGYAALRRAGRTAIVGPGLFALCLKVLNNPEMAIFASFGSIGLLMLVDFSGQMRARLEAQAALSVVGAFLICLGTLASQQIWLATLAMAVVAFAVIFLGVVSSVLAGATTSLLLAFILPTSLSAPASTIPDRLAGWGLAAGVGFLAVWLLWPAPARYPLRVNSASACRAIAARLRADVEWVRSPGAVTAATRESAVSASAEATTTMQREFLATPWRPTSLSTAGRAVVRLTDEITWLNAIAMDDAAPTVAAAAHDFADTIRTASADALDASAAVLEPPAAPLEALSAARDRLRAALEDMARHLVTHLPSSNDDGDGVKSASSGASVDRPSDRLTVFLNALEPSFRVQEIGYATQRIGTNVERAARADRRGLFERVAGQEPGDLSGSATTARERIASHLNRHSVWLHNSVRGSIGLAVAVLVAEETGLQHAFWVILGTLSVLRSSALATGQNVVRAVLGTVVGFVIGAALVELIGTNSTLLWFLLPISILIAGFAPTAISFAAGQAGFTLALVILFNLFQPLGWRIGLIRAEDVAIGCAVSVGVGLLLWPSGAGAELGTALRDAYLDATRFLTVAVERVGGVARAAALASSHPNDESDRVAASSRRLDDAFRTYLAERGSRPTPLADVTSLVTGVATIRLSAEAIEDLWESVDGARGDSWRRARGGLVETADDVEHWYRDLANGFVSGASSAVPDPDTMATTTVLSAVRETLGESTDAATAVRIVWTADHLDVVRRLESSLAGPSRAASELWGDHAFSAQRWGLKSWRRRGTPDESERP